MTLSKFSLSSSTFESIRKQAKKLVRQVANSEPAAIARVHAKLPEASLPLSLRDAQLVLAREYGFEGWQGLRAAMLRPKEKGLGWAIGEAESAIHDNNVVRLAQLVQEYPTLVSVQGDFGESLLSIAAGSFGDSFDPFREQTYTRIECAEFLLDAGAAVDAAIWENAIRTRSKGILQLLSRKGVLPHRLDILAAQGDYNGVANYLESEPSGSGNSTAQLEQALLCACRFEHRAIAEIILNRCVEVDEALGKRIERWRGRNFFIEYLVEHPQAYGNPWQPVVSPWHTVVMAELLKSIDEDSLEEFTKWLRQEPILLEESQIALQVDLLEHAVLKDRGPFIARLLEFDPAVQRGAVGPPSSALEFALEYGRAHLIPMLTPIWPMPDDLCHAAGVGDFSRVKGWFDEAGLPKLGTLSQHYPTNNPSILRNLRWSSPNAQQVLDVALSWSCVNRQFEIATFLLERGANINTDWGTHEPASILHECAVSANYEAAQFLIDHGIDMTIRDHRWNATAEGWAYYAAQDKTMAEFLADAERVRKA